LQNAKAVFHFSQSTREYFASILGDKYPWRLLEHGIEMPRATGSDGPQADAAKPSADRPLNVAFLGGIGFNKGAQLVERVTMQKTLPSGIPVAWHLIGLIDGNVGPSVQQHGKYQRDELPGILDRVKPDVVAIMSIWPETYCYTFDEALACRVPVVCTPLGAPAERLERLQCGWKMESPTVGGLMGALQHIVDHWGQYHEVRRRLASIPRNDVANIARQYFDIYRDNCVASKLPAEERLAAIEELFAEDLSGLQVWLRKCAGRSLNASVSAMEALRVRSLIAGVLRRVLSVRMRHKILELRQHIFWS
jgi:hypothetical protein